MMNKKLLEAIKAEIAQGCNIGHTDVLDLINHILMAEQGLKAIASCPDMHCAGCRAVATQLLKDSSSVQE